MIRPPSIPVDLWDAIPSNLRPAIAAVVAGLLEIPATKPHVTEYRRHRLTCSGCGAVTCGQLPADAEGGYGPRIQAVCALLAGGHRLGKRAISQTLGDLFGLPINPAAVCDLQAKTAVALAPVHAETLAATRTRPANVDETGWTQGGTKAWLWVAVTATVTAFVIRLSRSRVAFTDLAGPNPPVLTTDRYAVYDHLPGDRRQACWAHLRPDFQAMVDRTNGGSVRSLLERGAASSCPKTAGTCREILGVESSLWTFARLDGVEPTNNAAERAVRHAVCWRKTSYGTDSAAGNRFVERVLTVVASCRQQGRDVLAFLIEAVQAGRTGTAPPSLVPAGV